MSEYNEQTARFDSKALLEAGRVFLGSTDPAFIARSLALSLMGKLLATRAAILLQEDQEGYRVLFSRGKHPYAPDGPVPSDAPEKPFFVTPGGEWSRLLGSEQTASLWIVLGRSNGEMMFDEHQLEWIENLGNMAAISLRNAIAIEQLKVANRALDRKVMELNTLFEASKEFNTLLDRQRVLNLFRYTVTGQLLVRKLMFAQRRDGVSEGEVLVWSGFGSRAASDELVEQAFEDLQSGTDGREGIEVRSRSLCDIGLKRLIPIGGEREAVIAIGERLDGSGLTDAEFRLVESVANLALLSLERIGLLEEMIEKRRMMEELEIARRIQKQLIPDPIPQIEELDAAAVNIPSKEVGGDYLDVAGTPDGNMIYAIGDVSGKGVPASLLMANLQAMIHVLLPVEIELSEAMGRINDLLCENTPADKFVTFFLGKYHRDTGVFRYVNAGHNPPYLLREGREEAEPLDRGGMLLGAVPTPFPYEVGEVELRQGDLVAMFTDGVTETFDPAGKEEFGEERLLAALARLRHLGAREILQGLLTDVGEYGGSVFGDDLTLLLVKKR